VPQGPGQGQAYLDAVFLSPHKFIGGPGTPGVLAVRASCSTTACRPFPAAGPWPTSTGGAPLPLRRRPPRGGRDPANHRVHPRRPRPSMLKQAVGTDLIRRAEEDFLRRAVQGWSRSRHRGAREPRRRAALHRLLRGQAPPAAGCTTTRGRAAQRPLRHPDRGGCSGAGPTATGCWASTSSARTVRARDHPGHEGLKPGWVRVNFNYFISEAVFATVVEACPSSPSTAGASCPTTASTPSPPVAAQRGLVEAAAAADRPVPTTRRRAS
jgi:hypothetical protein